MRRELAGGLYATSRPFTTSPPLHEKQPWKLAPHQPPSVHPHPHHDTAFDSLSGSEQLRTVMRLLPHSVVVCTSASASASTTTTTPSSDSSSTSRTASVPRGMTMSSFTSLTLHPTPLITFNIATPSRTLDAVSHSRRFNIHVLSGDADGARVADWFRRGNAEGLGVFEAGKMKEGCGCEVVGQKQEQEQHGLEGDVRGGAPLLRGPGVLYALRCRLLDDEPVGGLVRVRDHVLVVAEVVDIVEGVDREGEEPFGLISTVHIMDIGMGMGMGMARRPGAKTWWFTWA
ncbi:hypothetical protein VP1G_05241 [Cytospora mali]|uniref:Flavin reductase like domain-containing protein n=1 Tax=Cytospora mali TaxID=578113 RepID=A0A194V280_CYTMA|nr:hypothetical protein VP1G_05241 [Valsa mali var. pyri (nom. inval.)]